MATFIRFDETGTSPSGRTKKWSVKTKEGIPLGDIGWYASWRRYVFKPYIQTLYEEQCLKDIADFLEQETKAQKAKAKED